jgi:hypothetical protein
MDVMLDLTFLQNMASKKASPRLQSNSLQAGPENSGDALAHL